MGARTLLIVDLSYNSYRASAAFPRLTSGRHFTGGLYGFWMSLAKLINEVQATDLVIGEDTKPYLRSLDYPEYKANRKGNKQRNEELVLAHKASLVLIRETAQALGVPLWAIPGFEFDDLAAHAAIRYRHRFTSVVAASNDSDLWQLLGIRGFRIRPAGPETEWDLDRLRREHDLEPEQYMLATAMTGTHNAVEGINKVGMVTAIKAIRNPATMRELRAKHGHIIDRNLGLIKLPHPRFPTDARMPITEAEFDARTVYRVFGRYDIEVTQSLMNAMERVLK